MTRAGSSLQKVLMLLEDCHGTPVEQPLENPFEQILHVNVAYLVNDDRHRQVFARFRKAIGLKPEAILAASLDEIRDVIKDGGMHATRRASRIVEAAEIVVDDYDGDLSIVLDWPPKDRKKALARFPGIGGPGVEKLLLFSRKEKVLALESNGLRVLQRVGFGQEKKSYHATYKSTQEAIADELPQDFDTVIKAHQLLRKHGKEICRRSHPECTGCRLKSVCMYARHRS